jgi:branched-chain amino acid transport system ATP-binding protein
MPKCPTTLQYARLIWVPAMLDALKNSEVLTVKNLNAFYGESHILHDVNFKVIRGEVVTLLGRNGAGKSTTLKSIMGIVGNRKGSLMFGDKELIALRPDQVGRLGIAFCPEERAIFSTLSVEENLMLPPIVKAGGMSVDAIYKLFPNLWERRHSQGTKMSGGEQQMLAIARILRTGSDFLLLDEPTEGLAPVIVQQIGAMIRDLRSKGFTILLVEQNFHFAATVADRHYIMESGRVVDLILKDQVEASMDKLNEYLGV